MNEERSVQIVISAPQKALKELEQDAIGRFIIQTYVNLVSKTLLRGGVLSRQEKLFYLVQGEDNLVQGNFLDVTVNNLPKKRMKSNLRGKYTLRFHFDNRNQG